ncbi:MAG: 2-iminobutanoate/2-iminopropanoate deaminase [Kribbellaceae bacterium]|jgi:2-iminobutanoate/2-iminopropanoate deaminase|nr:2-iminobutanoate/2-iminopropanoate deaminase [Kribbellaceae bacterium]
MTAAAHPRPDLPAVDTANAPQPRGNYSQARIVGDLIFTAGLVPLDPETRSLVGEGDVAEQTRQVLRNLQAILAAAGATLDDVVKITVFLADRDRDWEAYDAVFPEFFTPPYPARLTAGAHLGNILVEIEAVASRPNT